MVEDEKIEDSEQAIASDLENEKKIIMSNVSLARAFTQGWHSNIRRWRDLYNFDHYKYDKKAKSGETRFSDPTYTNTVDLTVGIFQANDMNWKVRGWTPGAAEQEYSANAEKFLKAVIDVNSEREEYDIIYETNLHFVRDGGAVIYTVWDTEIEEDGAEYDDDITDDGEIEEGMRYLNELPVTIKVIDPLKMSMLPGGSANRWACIVREEEVSVYDVEATYSVKLKKYERSTLTDKLDTKESLIDYWDVQYETNEDGKRVKYFRNAVLYADEFIMPPRKMDGYSGYPYDIDFFKPTSRDNSSEWHGIMQPMETTLKLFERSVNRRQRQIDIYADLPFVSKTRTGRPVHIDPGMGKVIGLDTEESFGMAGWVGNPPDVDKQLELLRSRVQQSGFSDIMFGSGASNVSGYALSQLGDQNRIRLAQPISHLNSLWTRWAKKVLKMTEAFAPDACINIYGKLSGETFVDKVYGKDLKGLNVACEIEPRYPNEEVRNVAMATQLRGIGLSLSTIMENYLHMQQPTDERKRKIIEDIQNSPAFIQYAMLKELKRMSEEGDGDEVAKELYNSLVQQPVQTGAGGRPVEGNKPQQPLGMESSTGLASPQATGNPAPGMGETDFMANSANAAPNMSGGVM